MAEVKTHITAEEYFQQPETTQPIQLLHGEVIIMPSPVPLHQRLIRRIARLVEDLIPNGEVFTAPMDVKFDEINVPQPDVIWVAEGSRCVIGTKWLEGPPDLIVEILSPGTARTDRKVKFQLYEKYGVREYWICDGEEKLLEAWQHLNGRFVLIGIFDSEDTFISPLLGNVELKRIFGE